jgi:hypothetical protein
MTTEVRTSPKTLCIIQFNSYLFMCKLNSSEANYKVSTSKEEEKIHIKKNTKNKAINIIIIKNNNNSINTSQSYH